ncbi:PleD family two-component system response regulator [candidate division CSSED10-310 bacterium]|uniref:PleD family two-component system response regulator n=1 Tax=candidate division CSSED10-310 bacterium TaxID=2855610 RepID=A0ABV6YTX0_UNCC1
MTKILLVDDAQTVLLFEKMLLSKLGFEFMTASNGQEALEQIEQERPALILMDYRMPIMDGYTCCKTIKSNAETKDIPVIMVTTISEEEEVQRCFDVGCNDYIFKPFNKQKLLEKIKKFIPE